jgi:hypothetical protein
MRLMNSRLCLDCEEVHDQQHCPVCGSESFAFLTRWVAPADAVAEAGTTRTVRPPNPADRREQIDAYRQILNPSPQQPRRGRMVAHGALGLALLGLARLVWRAAPEPKSDGSGRPRPVTNPDLSLRGNAGVNANLNPKLSTSSNPPLNPSLNPSLDAKLNPKLSKDAK